MTPPNCLLDHEAQTPAGDHPPQVEIVIPVRNEERDLDRSVRRLLDYLKASFPFASRVIIADNGSTDRTWAVASALEQEFTEVHAVRLEEPGRGRALRTLWSASDAVVLAYMDVDLSTDLNALLPLVAPLLSGHSDLAIGTRLARGARVIRGPCREVISPCYNVLLHATLGTRFSEAQCGFKAIRADKAKVLLPLTRDTAWFFDTELLVLAERAGLRIQEVPVDWVDDADSRGGISPTAVADLRGIARMGWGRADGTTRPPVGALAAPADAGDMRRQILRFVVVGVASTLAYLLIYRRLRGGMAAQPANVVSLLLTAIGNTTVNRRFTFGIRGRTGSARHQARGLIAFGAGLLLTSAALAALHLIAARPTRMAEVSVLLAANLAATVIRFALYRRWVFRHKAPPAPSDPAAIPAAPRLIPSTFPQPEGVDR